MVGNRNEVSRSIGARFRQYSPAAVAAPLRRIRFSLRSLIIPVVGLAASLSVGMAMAYWENQVATLDFNAVVNSHRQMVDAFSTQTIFTRHSGALALFAMGLLLTAVIQFYVTKRKRAERALAESEETLKAIFDAAADGIALAEFETKRFRLVNPSFCRMLGYSQHEMLNLNVPDIHPKEDIRQIVGAFEQQTTPTVELRVKRKDGSIFFAQLSTSAVTLGGTLCLLGLFRDITERKTSQDALKQAHDESLALVTVLRRHEHEMVLLTELNDVLQACNSRDEAFPIIAAAVNHLFPDTSGGLALVASRMLEAETVAQWGADQAMLPHFSLDDCWALRTGQMRKVDGADEGAVCRHFKFAPNGPYICLPLTIHGETTGLLYLNVGASGVIDQDLTQLLFLFGNVIKLSLSNLKLRDTLFDRSIRDPLTGLFNRRYLDETLVRELHHAYRAKASLCLAMLDVDHFKIFNDENGHEAGDEVLRAIGEILKNSTRVSDIACRFGGEEFILILNGMDSSTALPHVEQICHEIKRKQVICNGKPLCGVTVSAGLAQAPAHGASPEELLRAADTALYAAKSAGRDRVEVFPSRRVQITALPAA